MSFMASNIRSRRLLTFDAWETLFGAKQPVHKVYHYYAKQYGQTCYEARELEYRLPLAIKEHRLARPLFGCRDLKTSEEKFRATEDWWGAVIQSVFAPQQCSPEMRRDIYKHFSAGSAYSLKVGARDVLGRLRQQGIILGILSNFDIRIHSILKDLEILDYFSFVALSVDCGHEKPSEKIFNLATYLAQIELSEGEILGERYHVGNDREKDAIGASRAGWRAVYLDETVAVSPRITKFSDEVVCISSLPHLQSMFN